MMECSAGCDCRSMLNKTDAIVLAEHEVFPGISVVRQEAQTRQYSQPGQMSGEQLCIHHCREGWLEYESDRHFFCLLSGHIAVVRTEDREKQMYFPTGSCQTISVVIDLERISECLAEQNPGVKTSVDTLTERFIGTGCYVVPAPEALEPLFVKLYGAEEQGNRLDMEDAVVELLHRLCGETPVTERPASERRRVELARQVCAVLEERVDVHISIEELADRFGVSPTQVKKCFHSVYDASVYAYSRMQKMQSAARMLRKGDLRILDVAQAHGYANASKFAKAFQDVFGMTPKEFRQNQR